MPSFPLEPDAQADARFAPIDFRAELNDDQYAAVTAGDGPALVLAGAGSGKTRTLTYRVAYLLNQGIWPNEILLLTFTNKAAREMLGRVEALTGVQGYRFWGGTFHSIGQRVLRMHGEALDLDKNFTIMDQGDAESLLGEVIRGLDGQFLKNKDNPKARVIADIISYARNTCAELPDTLQQKYPWHSEVTEKIVDFAKEYQARKLRQQVCDYDDLLELWLKLLEQEAEVCRHYQKRFKYILVDEYQDTNRLQSRIIDRIAGDHQVMAVGDDAQCIYTWRGADFENIMNFSERHPHTTVHKIEINYRSTPEILNFANRVLRNQPSNQGFHKELIAQRPSNQKPFIIPTMDSRQQAWYVIKRIQDLQYEGYCLKDIAILYRAHYQAMDMQMELSKQGIPYTITSGVRFFEQAHVRDLVAQIRFASNPRDSSAFIRMAMLLSKIGTKTAERLYKLLQQQGDQQRTSPVKSMTDEAVLKKVPKDAMDDWKDLAFTLQDMEAAMGGPKVSKVDPKAQQDNLFDAAERQAAGTHQKPKTPREVIHIAIDGWYGDFMRGNFENWRTRKDDLDSLLGFADRFEDMSELLAQLVLLNSETSDRSINPDEATVRLTTIHQAKGLEYPIVFLIGAADNLFPLKRAIDSGDIEEERRLFYVGVTRAKDELYITFPRVHTQGGPPQMLEPSRFITELDPECYEIVRK